MALALALCAPTQASPGRGRIHSSVCAYLRVLLDEVDSSTALGRCPNMPVMGLRCNKAWAGSGISRPLGAQAAQALGGQPPHPVFGTCTTVSPALRIMERGCVMWYCSEVNRVRGPSTPRSLTPLLRPPCEHSRETAFPAAAALPAAHPHTAAARAQKRRGQQQGHRQLAPLPPPQRAWRRQPSARCHLQPSNCSAFPSHRSPNHTLDSQAARFRMDAARRALMVNEQACAVMHRPTN